jgi:hypothetical protein
LRLGSNVRDNPRMRSMRQLLFVAVGLLAAGCQILSYTWTTPPSVPEGRMFTMEVTGQTDSTPGRSAVVFQLPNAFTVLGVSAISDGNVAGLTRDLPGVLALYTPDPGHYLASFSGGGGVGSGTCTVRLQVCLQAPSTPGLYQLEMALATESNSVTFVPQLGLHSFQAPGGSVVRPLLVTREELDPYFLPDRCRINGRTPLNLRELSHASVQANVKNSSSHDRP